MTAPPLTLTAGDLCATITGGDLLSVSSLVHRDSELLVTPDELPVGYRVHGTRAGISLLHPWANRLGGDVYRALGRDGRLDGAGARVTRDANGLAIHGLAAAEPWDLGQAGSSLASASLSWPGEPGFPFPHRVAVRFELDVDADGSALLRVQTTVTALADDPVPVALGWHPYFRRQDPATIDLPALSVLEADAQGLPTGAEVPQPASSIALSDQSLDFGVSGLSSGTRMRLDEPGREITVVLGDGYTYGQVFAPHDAAVVSLEPMTGPTDALARGTHLPVADPEHPYTASFVVRVSGP